MCGGVCFMSDLKIVRMRMRMNGSGLWRSVAAAALVGCLGLQAVAQQVGAPMPTDTATGPLKDAAPAQLAGSAKDNSRHFGDDPDDGGPIATDISPKMTPAAVDKVMRKVADWQLARSEPFFDRIWTWSVLYSGFMATSDATGDMKYRDAMERMSEKFNWELRSKTPNADDQ